MRNLRHENTIENLERKIQALERERKREGAAYSHIGTHYEESSSNPGWRIFVERHGDADIEEGGTVYYTVSRIRENRRENEEYRGEMRAVITMTIED